MAEIKNKNKELINKWSELLNVDKLPKLHESKIEATALMLENEANFLNGNLHEDATTTDNAFNSTGSGFANNGLFYNIAVPMVRRTFPELLAHDLVGVQPMNGPVGIAFALRYKAGQAYTDRTVTPNVSYAAGTAELGYNAIDKNYTGSLITSAGEALGSKAGSGVGSDLGLGIGSGEHIKDVSLSIEKATVETRTRKLRTRWSLEVQQDLKAMHGLDVESQMLDVLNYELIAEKDRELIDTINACAVSGAWNYDPTATANGRWEAEKYRSLYLRIIRESNEVARTTRRGPANWIVASPRVCAALESLADFIIAPVDNSINTASFGVSKVGAIGGRLMLYRDTFERADTLTMGYKGPHPWDTGIIYLPYIELMLSKQIFEDSFHPTMGLMSRYGIHSHIFGCSLFYRKLTIQNMPD